MAESSDGDGDGDGDGIGVELRAHKDNKPDEAFV